MSGSTPASGPDSGALARLKARLPAPLSALAPLAYNYWWSWQRGGEEVFRDVDPGRWASSGGNPVRLLLESARLDEAAADAALVSRVEALGIGLAAELSRPCAEAEGVTPARPIAFFCAEYGIHRSLPIYAGGLGVLAGDFLKEASDRALPLIGIGLFYRRGYFHQRLDPSGWQHEYWVSVGPDDLPALPVLRADGTPVLVQVPVRGEQVHARIWRVHVGRVPLLLLDSDVEGNSAVGRWLTSRLYVGDRVLRLMQYAMLGIGGSRALAAIGITPSLFHLNEGHAALATLSLIADELRAGSSLPKALAAAKERVVFTTHTPVAAGNESYGRGEAEFVLGAAAGELGLPLEDLLALGRRENGGEPRFGLTELALRASRSANAVSRRHGQLARAMWQPLFAPRPVDAVPVSHVTNGVHLPTWMAPAFRDLLDRHLGPGWEMDPDPARKAAIDAIPDDEIWAVRNQLRAQLVRFARVRSVVDRLERGMPIGYVDEAELAFDPAALTIGFARRVASYKRLHLLVRNPARALPLLRGPRALQVVLAGKAHPSDDDAKRIVQAIFALKAEQGVSARVIFLEDYDLALAPSVLAGCDVWVNLPRPPNEACGTSGMKAALNGGLNLAVLDGWWWEGFDGHNGWAIRSDESVDPWDQDGRDAEALYDLLEREVVPLFHDRDAAGVPHAWVRLIKASLRSIVPAFCSTRMLRDYLATVYRAGHGPAEGSA